MDDKQFLAEYRRQLNESLKRWERLTEGITDVELRSKVSMLLDVQAQKPARNPFFEADQNTGTLPTSVFPSQIAFPAIVRAFPALVANDLVQVQPMSQPRALVPYMRFYRSSPLNELTRQGSWVATAEQGTPNKVRLRMDTVQIDTEKKMLNLEWSSELEEDLSALGGYDLQALLVGAVQDEIRGQIDYQVIQDLYTLAGASQVVGSTGIVTVSAGAGNVNFSFAAAGGSADTTRDKQNLFLDAVTDAKVLIYNASRMNMDFICGTAADVARIEKMDSFVTEKRAPGIQTGSTYKAGRLNGQYDVYISDAAQSNKFLVGVKQHGFILGLYRPLELTVTNYKNDSDEFIRGVRTRIGRKATDGMYFGTITITG